MLGQKHSLVGVPHPPPITSPVKQAFAPRFPTTDSEMVLHGGCSRPSRGEAEEGSASTDMAGGGGAGTTQLHHGGERGMWDGH